MASHEYVDPSTPLAQVSYSVRKEIADLLSYHALGHDWQYLAEKLNYSRAVIQRFFFNGNPALSLVQDLADVGITYGVMMDHLRHMDRVDIPNYSDTKRYRPPQPQSQTSPPSGLPPSSSLGRAFNALLFPWMPYVSTPEPTPPSTPLPPPFMVKVDPPISTGLGNFQFNASKAAANAVFEKAKTPPAPATNRPKRVLDLSYLQQRELSLSLGNDWRDLAHQIGFRRPEIAGLSADSQPARALVQAMGGKGTTLDQLCAALRQAGLSRVIDDSLSQFGYVGDAAAMPLHESQDKEHPRQRRTVADLDVNQRDCLAKSIGAHWFNVCHSLTPDPSNDVLSYPSPSRERALLGVLMMRKEPLETLRDALETQGLNHAVKLCTQYMGPDAETKPASTGKKAIENESRLVTEILDSQEAVLREANKKLDAQRRSEQELREKIRAEVLAETQRQQESIDNSAVDASTCAICMDKKREYLVLPCAHNIYCEECQKKAAPTCPYCRAPVVQIVRIMTP